MKRAPKWQRPSARARGYILVSTVMFVLILTILGTSVLSFTPPEQSLITDRQNYLQAFMYAESGASRSLDMIRNSGDLTAINSAALRGASTSASTNPFLLVAQRHTGLAGDSSTTGQIQLYTANQGPLVIISTGHAGQAMGYSGETRSIQMVYNIITNPLYDPKRLLTVGGDYSAKKDQTLTGKIVVATAADSAALVSGGVPKDSVSVAPVPMPDFTDFIKSKTAGTYQTLTAAQLGASDAGNPLAMGLNNNGIYYAANGIGGPAGHPAYLTIYGTVYILVTGTLSIPKDLIITAGNGSATLVMIADNPGGTGLDFAKQPQNNGVPLIMMTNGDVNFKKGTGESLTNVSIFGANVSMDKEQTWSYNHSVMDPIMNYLINSGGLPLPGGALNGATLSPVAGQWMELRTPRLN